MTREDRDKVQDLMKQGMSIKEATETIKATTSGAVAPTPCEIVEAETEPPIETVEDAGEILLAEYKPRIENAIEEYTAKLGETLDYWRKKGKPQEWRGLCAYVGDTVFGDPKALREKPTHPTPVTDNNSYLRSAMTNNNAYDIDKLDIIYDYFVRLCAFVGLPCKYGDFALFTHISFKSWLDLEKRLTAKGAELRQKAIDEQGQSIAAAAEGSRIQPVIALARLNAFHGWERRSEVVHSRGGDRRTTGEIAADMGLDSMIDG